MIRFEQVSKRYSNGFDALKGVSFHIQAGEMVYLTGHSGAGKSTLLKLIMAMEQPTRGLVQVNGAHIKGMGNGQIPYHRRQIGVVFQNHQLLFDRTIYDNVALPLIISGFPQQETGRRVRAALDKVGLLNKEKRFPLELSGGEQQRVGIARAVVNKPRILLVDEPTGNLDPALSADIMHLFRQFNEVGVTLLIASHDLDLIRRQGKRVLTLREGQLAADGLLEMSNG